MVDFDYENEHCDSEEIHEELLSVVRNQLPAEEKLYDLAELFKVFGDSTRMRILFVLLEAEVCVCDLAAALGDVICRFASAGASSQEQAYKKPKRRKISVLFACR